MIFRLKIEEEERLGVCQQRGKSAMEENEHKPKNKKGIWAAFKPGKCIQTKKKESGQLLNVNGVNGAVMARYSDVTSVTVCFGNLNNVLG